MHHTPFVFCFFEFCNLCLLFVSHQQLVMLITIHNQTSITRLLMRKNYFLQCLPIS